MVSSLRVSRFLRGYMLVDSIEYDLGAVFLFEIINNGKYL